MIRRGAEQLRHRRGRLQRTAGVFTCVLVVLLLVGMLCVQTTQTLLIIRRSDMERAKLYQAREVVELGRHVDWRNKSVTSFTVAIPQSVTRDSAPAELMAEVEGLRGDTPATEVERLIVHYPIEQLGKVTATWERNDE